METVTIQDFTVFPVNTTLKTTPAFPTPDTTTPETCLNITAIANGYHKIGMTQNTAITNGFRIGKGIEFGIRTTTLAGTQMILPFLEFWVVGCRNYKVSKYIKSVLERKKL